MTTTTTVVSSQSGKSCDVITVYFPSTSASWTQHLLFFKTNKPQLACCSIVFSSHFQNIYFGKKMFLFAGLCVALMCGIDVALPHLSLSLSLSLIKVIIVLASAVIFLATVLLLMFLLKKKIFKRKLGEIQKHAGRESNCILIKLYFGIHFCETLLPFSDKGKEEKQQV